MRPNRVQRSMLSVPGSRPALFPKAARSGADQVMIDLEDAVAPDDKEAARDTATTGLSEVNWKANGQTVTVRINDTETPWMVGDVRAVVTGAGRFVDTLMVPKVTGPNDVIRVAALLDELEEAQRVPTPIGLEVLIETARGLAYINEIASSHPRLEALHFGAGDFGASMGARTLSIGEGLGVGNRWNAARTMIAVAARAHGLRPIDSAYDDFHDDDGYLAEAREAAGLGFEGKWAIHPRQVPLANLVFSPTPDEVEAARGLLKALEAAAAEGRGAARYRGKMIDAASARLADNILRIAERVPRS
ncbi:MAG: CoA ester lyase [bacterium]|nr:CoA ester lyase [bacterium]